MRGQCAVGEFECLAQLVEIQRRLAPHVEVLRALAREQEGEFARARRRAGAVADVCRQRLAAALELAQQGFDIGGERRGTAGDDGRGDGLGAQSLCLARECEGQLGEIQARGLPQRRQQRGELFTECRRAGGLEQAQLVRPAIGTRRCGVGGVFLQHHMEVGAAEAEGRSAAATRMRRVCEPGARVLQQHHRRGRIGNRLDGRLHTDMRRQHAAVQGEHDLDHAAHTRCGLGVAEDGFHRTERHTFGCRTGFAQRAADGLRLGAITHRSAGAVRLDQAERGGREAGLGIGAVERAYLALAARRGQAQGLAVRRTRCGLDEAVDAVAIALGVGEALEHDHRHALGDGDAIGGLVEGFRLAGAGERGGLGEGHEGIGRLRGVEAARERDIAAARLQLVDRDADRRERGSAGGVDGVVDATEIHAVGDTARRDVEQRAGEGFLRPFRQPVPHLLAQVLDEARQLGAQGVLGAQVARATTGTEHDGGVLFVVTAVGIARIGERAAGGFECQDLQGVDRLHRLGRDAEAGRVEADFVEKAAPARIHLVALLGVFVEVELPVPPALRHLAQHADLAQHIAPVLVGVVGLGQHQADADDGDIAGLLFEFWCVWQTGFEQGLRALGHVQMQGFDAHRRIPQRGDLADHVHAIALLLRNRHIDHLAIVAAVHALAGDAQAAEVQVFQRITDFLAALAFLQQAAALGVEVLRELGIDATAGMAGAGFEIHRPRAGDGLGLEGLDDCTGGDDLIGEQVSRAHQAADLHAARGERCGHCRHHRGRARIVDAAREQHVHALVRPLGRVFEQHRDHLLPQRKARQRADMPAAFAALEHEAARALFEIELEQRRCGRVDVGGDAALLELGSLIRAATRDERERRLALPDRLALLLPQRVRHEAQHAHAPGCVVDQRLCRLQHFQHLWPARQGQRQKRQRAGLGDFRRKRGRIADARHRPLREREARAVRCRQRPAFAHRRQRYRLLDVLHAGLADGLDQLAGAAEIAPVLRGETNRLA